MDSLENSLLRSLLPAEISQTTEVLLKNIALLLGLLSAIAIILIGIHLQCSCGFHSVSLGFTALGCAQNLD
tara:strand:+ start:294 stop:506 length:213 start_codon:yes stop_codon:yes gene_type:complete